MYNIIALIPARLGSKRIIHKNIKLLGSKPLLAWTIETALQAQCFSQVFVSTESEIVATIAREYGAEVPWLRDHALAQDDSKMSDVALEFIKQLKDSNYTLPDGIMILQPTSPFRTIVSIKKAVEIFTKNANESVVSLSLADPHPYWCRSVNENGEISPLFENIDFNLQSQELPMIYQVNGLIYLVPVKTLLNKKSLYSNHTQALIINDEQEVLDIDNEMDWLLAEAFI